MLHDTGDTTGPVEGLHLRLGSGIDLGDLGRGLGKSLELLQHVHIQLRLVGDGGQVQHGVGGAADGHGHLDGVADGLLGEDLTGGDALLAQLYNGTAGLEGVAQTAGVSSGDQSATGQGHAQCLGHAAHGVGGAKEGTGAAAGTGGVLQRVVLALGDLTGLQHTQGLGDGGQVGLTAVELDAAQHGTAHADNAGDIQTSRRHQHGRHDLIAGGQQHQTVQPVGLCHDLHGVADDLTGGQNVVHTLMALCHTIAGSDGAELHSGAAGGIDAVFHILSHLVQIVVAGNQRVPGVGNADQGLALLQFAVRVAHGLEQGAGKCAVLHAKDRLTTVFHCVSSFKYDISLFLMLLAAGCGLVWRLFYNAVYHSENIIKSMVPFVNRISSAFLKNLTVFRY